MFIGPTGFRNSISNKSNNRAAIVGGSTAFGSFSSSDRTTIASSLNKMTNQFNFENLNSPSWNSHQEMVAIATNLEKYLIKKCAINVFILRLCNAFFKILQNA